MFTQIAQRTAHQLSLAAAVLVFSAAPAAAQTFLGFNSQQGPFYLLLGSSGLTEPMPLTLSFDGPVFGDTSIMISSDQPATLIPAAGDVIVPTGLSSVQLNLTGLALGDATLTAQLGGSVSTVTVSVVDSIPTVPEPSTAWALLGGLGLLLVRSRAVRAPAALSRPGTSS